MKILTPKKQKAIKKNRNVIYECILNNPKDDTGEIERVIEALADLSFDCGIWNESYYYIPAWSRKGKKDENNRNNTHSR